MGNQNFLFFPRSSFFNLSLLQYYLGKELRFFFKRKSKEDESGFCFILRLATELILAYEWQFWRSASLSIPD